MSFTTIIAGVASTGVILMGIGYLVSQYKSGKSKGQVEAIDNNIKTLDLLSRQVIELQQLSGEQGKMIVDLEGKVDKLTILVEEKDQKIQEYIKIFQNRNPQLDDFIKLLTEVANKATVYMENDIKDSSERKVKIEAILRGVDRLQGAQGLVK